MRELEDKKLNLVVGGGFNIGIGIGIVAGITFLIGVIDGIVRPLKCN